jgi:hypothetical protein
MLKFMNLYKDSVLQNDHRPVSCLHIVGCFSKMLADSRCISDFQFVSIELFDVQLMEGRK